tara:strand:+ start:43 stop:357 length:315 start_codon:yes stop_codon:yes gene_type:complete
MEGTKLDKNIINELIKDSKPLLIDLDKKGNGCILRTTNDGKKVSKDGEVIYSIKKLHNGLKVEGNFVSNLDELMNLHQVIINTGEKLRKSIKLGMEYIEKKNEK